MIYHCRVFDADGTAFVKSYHAHEVEYVQAVSGSHIRHIALPDGNATFYFAVIDDSDKEAIPALVQLPSVFHYWKSYINPDPNRQPPCFLAPDGKIYRSSDYQEVF